MRIFNIILVAQFLFLQPVKAQHLVKADVCKSTLFEYLEKMESKLAVAGNRIYHVKYTVSTVFSEELKIPSSKTTTEVYAGKNKILMNDKKMNVYGNDKSIFVVIPQYKKIYWNNSDPRIFEDANSYTQFLKIEKELLTTANSVVCKTTGDLLKITVIPSAKFAKQTKLLSQYIVYNKKLKRIVNVDNQYNRYHKIKRQSIVYESVDFNSSKKINAPITYLFDNKKLKNIYKGFEIIDNRQK